MRANTPAVLSYLPLIGENSDLGENYLRDLQVAQTFAMLNRKLIVKQILDHLKITLKKVDYIESVHNYIELESKTIRKGAISAKKGEKILIPFNMRDGLAVATGLGNEDWNVSAPHGAGRVLSRTHAKASLSMDDFKQSMEGIYTTSVSKNTIDESPMAYKDKDVIIEAIKPTANIEFFIKPIYNFKA